MKKYFLKSSSGKYMARTNGNKLYLTSRSVDKLTYTNGIKLINIRKSSIPKELAQFGPYILYYEDDDNIEINSEKSISEQIKNNEGICYKDETPGEYQEIKQKINDLSNTIQTLLSEKDNLVNSLSEVNGKEQDILHYIEFNKFNAAEGYKLSKRLQNIRKERRIIKNKIDIINVIKQDNCYDLIYGKTLERLDGIENRKYTPRVLNDLFNDKAI